MNTWPFDDPPNVAVIADRRIISGGAWIAYVSHDEDDGGWQFHVDGDAPPSESDAAVVGLATIVRLDETIVELADLPIGWHAWRESRGAPWHRAQTARSD